MITDDQEIKKTHEALQNPVRLIVFSRRVTWTLPNGTVKGWRVLVEQEHEKPFWITTYHRELTEPGYQFVRYDKNSRGERIIKPDRG